MFPTLPFSAVENGTPASAPKKAEGGLGAAAKGRNGVSETGAAETSSQENRKVMLDIEDAPFLQPQQDDSDVDAVHEDVPAAATEGETQDGDAAKGGAPARKKGKKKLLVFVAAALVVFVAAVCGAFFILGGDGEKAPTVPEGSNVRQVVVSSTPPTQESSPAVPSVVMAPFWVELKDTEGNVRFLVCKFVLTMKGVRTQDEVAQKMLPIRDALYYYLRNKPYAFYADPDNMNTLKGDAKTIINDYLVSDKLIDVLLDNYLIK